MDPAHGARWKSLIDPGGREKWWRRPDPARAAVRPGDGLVDVRGVEECFPGITGIPDHGDVWSAQGEITQSNWPTVMDQDDCRVLGPDDGTAVFCVLTDIDQLTVNSADGRSAIGFRLSCPDAPVSFGLWRNLGGFPDENPYRSFGVEPMLGRAPRVTPTDTSDAAVIPAGAVLAWRLVISSG